MFAEIHLTEYKVVELDKMDVGPAYQDALQDISGQRSVPNTYINSKHLDGCDDTMVDQANG